MSSRGKNRQWACSPNEKTVNNNNNNNNNNNRQQQGLPGCVVLDGVRRHVGHHPTTD